MLLPPLLVGPTVSTASLQLIVENQLKPACKINIGLQFKMDVVRVSFRVSFRVSLGSVCGQFRVSLGSRVQGVGFTVAITRYG